MASPRESTGAKDGVGAGEAGDTEIGNDDTEGGEGGEAPADCPGEPPSSKRGILRQRAVIFVLMIANVETLSGSKSNTQTPAYKSQGRGDWEGMPIVTHEPKRRINRKAQVFFGSRAGAAA